MKLPITILLLIATNMLYGQSSTIKGMIVTDKATSIKGIAVSLLRPEDSTLAFFGISNSQGYFEIGNAAYGNYVLQAAGVGYLTYYNKITLPLSSGNTLPPILLQSINGKQLEDVRVTAQKVPMLFKGDTVEYNAGSFKTKPDAAVEELLKKMPGIEVDKSGNIKAHGKDVEKVLVDGKEFFGNDPKVATKNLPADAIDKVQVFDGLSDAAQFTSVDDGTRDKTINLQLKNNKHKGYFGEAEGGAGTDSRYKSSAKLYRFQKKSQLAALGMINNINQFGFTLQDYLSFKGGIRALMEGGSELNGQSPINFGQPIAGLVTSGAAGVNYTFEPKAGRRYNVSYLGNGADKKLEQETDSRNYTGTETFARNENSDERAKDYGHRLYANLRHDLDSTNQLRVNINAGYVTSNTIKELLSSSTLRNAVLNKLDSHIEDASTGFSGDATLGWIKKMKGKWPVLKLSVTAGIDNSLSKTYWNNITTFTAAANVIDDNQYQHNDRAKYRYSGIGALTRSLGKGNYADVEIRAGHDYDQLNRTQGLAGREASPTDSLSLHFGRQYGWIRPGLIFRHNTKQLQYNGGIRAEHGLLQAVPTQGINTTGRTYVLPSAFLQYMPENRTTASLQYSTAITAPSARQMIPTTDYSNSVQRIHGNPLLLPEYKHTGYIGWHRYDQFSLTSIRASVQGAYTKDKINYTRRVNADLSEDISYANMPAEYNLSVSGGYSTPIRKLGINVELSIGEQYNLGQSIVNDVVNTNSGFTHRGKISVSNRNQTKWSATVALSGDMTNTRYSLQESLNSRFVHYNAYAELSFRPSDNFYFSATGDADRYTSGSFSDAVTIPLLKVSVTYYFLKSQRAALTIDAFDLLNQNKNIQRISQLNYLLEQRSNIIGRYVMLTFKYRLNHTGGTGPGMNIKIDR